MTESKISFFIRTKLKQYLRRARRASKRNRPPKVNLDEPIGNLTPEEIKYADEVMRIFREEDR